MEEVLGIKICNKEKIFYLKNKDYNFEKSDLIVVSDGQVVDLAEVVFCNSIRENNIEFDDLSVVRIATEKDLEKYKLNAANSIENFKLVEDIIASLNLEMKLISVSYSLNKEKLCISYFSEGRVDFRELLKELALVFKARIELYQANEREHSRKLKGLGPCGRPLCCSTFLDDFHPVSIKMVKDQNLIFNISKVTGVCGKLLCCLKYENDYYRKLTEELPDVGSTITYKNIDVFVKDIDPMREVVIVQNNEKEFFNIPIGEFIEDYK